MWWNIVGCGIETHAKWKKEQKSLYICEMGNERIFKGKYEEKNQYHHVAYNLRVDDRM